MEKTRLGISVGLLGAALYFIGLFSLIPLVILAGYVLLFENDKWLKKCAVKSVTVYVAFGLILALSGLVGNTLDFLNVIIGWLPGDLHLGFWNDIDSLISNAINVLRDLALLLLGFSALSQGSVKIGTIDNIVDRNM